MARHLLIVVMAVALTAAVAVALPSRGSAAYQGHVVDEHELTHGGWTLAANDVNRILRMRFIEEDMAKFRTEQNKLWWRLGRYTGNQCAYAAAARLWHFYGVAGSPPLDYFPIGDAWVNPGQLAEYLQDLGMSVRHDSFSQISGERYDYMRKVKEHVDNNTPPIILINLGSADAMHYVVVVAYRGEEFLVADWTGICRMTRDEFYDNSFNPWLLFDAYRTIKAW